MRTMALVAIASLLLAGCSDSGPGDDADDVDEASFDEFELDETQEALGVIRGVVVDTAINPVEGAKVSLAQTGRNVTTNAQGAFGFKDLPAGTYFVDVVKAGYSEVQASVEVVAGVKEPKAMKVLLERIPGTEPRVTPIQFDGFIHCSMKNPLGGFSTSCLLSLAVSDLGTDRQDFEVPGPNIHWFQSELTWRADQDLAKGLCYRIYMPTETPPDVCGEDPVIRTFDGKALAGLGLAQGGEIEKVVYVDHYVDGVIGLAVQQNFQIFSHVFHNHAPPEGWSFGEHGDPPVPA